MIDPTIENPCPDTVNFFCPFKSEEDFHTYLLWITPRLEQSELKRKNDTGAIVLTGKLRNMRVRVSRSGVWIMGSLCVFYKGNNYYTMTRNEVMLCILSLQVALGLSLLEASVRRIDFGCCLKMREKPESYFIVLGTCGKFESWQREHSFYYETGYKTLIFYNKKIEMKSRNFSNLPEQIHCNTLRYEIRLKKQLSYQLNREQVLVKDLYDEAFYKGMIDRWANEYERIHKNRTLAPITNTLSCKDGVEYTLSSLMILQGINNVTRIIDVVKDKFTRGSYSRYLKKLKTLKFLSKESHLAAELNAKISQVKEYAQLIASDGE